MADETILFPNSNPPEPAREPINQPVDHFAESEPASAEQRLRAFEDEHLGEDAPRHAGQVEKGHGSLFQRLSPEHRKAHGLIEKTAETEHKLNEARGKLAQAEADHAQACAAADDASKFGG